MSVDDLAGHVGEWLRGTGPLSDIVISSRIRLARNVVGFPFLSRASEDDKKEIYRSLGDALSNAGFGSNSFFVDIENISDVDKQVLVERHLISRQHAEGEGSRGVSVSMNETHALMINEEDHLRMQVLRSGLQLDSLWNEIGEIDDRLAAEIEFAFDDDLGYLTACPTNVGTGLRVSVMLHLPALKITGEIEKVLRSAKDLKLAVRGLFGEGTDAIGDFYQISNQVTLGTSEEEIIETFSSDIIPKIVEYEREAREALSEQRSVQLDDKVWRAYGILENARAMASEETMFFLSHLRLGVSMGRFDQLDIGTINELFLQIQPAHLQKLNGGKLSGEQRSIARANYLRERLGNNN
ncbi:MAG: protein arginine kinase [Planctomycetes bacterium]|nr:protein arginine kinase [Planctomycetota bacterium]